MADVHMTAAIVDGGRYETLRYPDDEIRLRVTDGDVQVVEYLSTDREGPPPHYHPWHEVEVVIEGEVEFHLHGEWTRGGPGTVQMLPAGTAHSVRVPAGEARLLYLTIGPPYDGVARELAALYAAGQVDPRQVDPQRVVAVANRHGVRLDNDRDESAASGDGATGGAMTHQLSTGDLAALRSLEEDLWREATRFDRQTMEAVLAADFFEYGRSGRVYSREGTLAVSRGPIAAVLPLPDFAARLLAPDVAQVTYNSAVTYDGVVEHARRSSIWTRGPMGWQLRFHQGTPYQS